MKKLHLVVALIITSLSVSAQHNRLNNHWYFFQENLPGIDIEWTENTPKSEQETGNPHPQLSGYYSTNVLYKNQGFGKEVACYAISGNDGFVHVYDGEGREAKLSNVKHQGIYVDYIEARKDEIGLLPIPGYTDKFIVIARINQFSPSRESGVFLLDFNGDNYDPNGLGRNFPNVPSLTHIGSTAPLLGKNYGSHECIPEYHVDGDAIAATKYNAQENSYTIYSCGLHQNPHDYVAIYKTVIDFDQFDPQTNKAPAVSFSSSPIAVSAGTGALLADAPFVSEMELSHNESMLAVAVGSKIWFMQLDFNGDVIPGSTQYLTYANTVGLEFDKNNKRLYISRQNNSFPSGKSKLSFVEIANEALVIKPSGNTIKEISGSDDFSNSQIEMGADGRIYGVKANALGTGGSGLVAYDRATNTVDNNALGQFFNAQEISWPEDYLSGTGNCPYEWQFFTLPDQIDNRSPILLLHSETVSYIGSYLSSAREGTSFLIEDENGTVMTDYPVSNHEGIAVVSLETGLEYRATQIFEEEWVPVLDYSSPKATNGYLTFQINKPEVYQGTFTSYNIEDHCSNIPGMVAYFHFQEQSGDQTVNLLGENASFFTTSQLSGNVIGAGLQVPTTTSLYLPNFSYNQNTLDIATNNVTMVSPSYPAINFSGSSFTVETYLKANAPTNATDMTIASKKAYDPALSATVGWEFGINNNEPYFEIRGHNGISTSSRSATTGNFIPNTSDYHHVGFVVNRATNTLEVYLNGSLYASYTLTPGFQAASLSTPGDLEMGKNLNGILDELSMYNRALDAMEMADAMLKCNDYLDVKEFTMVNLDGKDYHLGEIGLYNGYTTSKDMAYSISPILSSSAGCNVNGPGIIWGNHGRVALGPGSGETRNFLIPFISGASPTDIGCLDVWMYNEFNQVGLSHRVNSSMMDQYNPPPSPTSVGSINAQHSLQLYPNPTQNGITISAGDIIQRIEVFTLSGVQVQTLNMTNADTVYLDLSDLSEGIYVVRATIQAETYSARFVKQ